MNNIRSFSLSLIYLFIAIIVIINLNIVTDSKDRMKRAKDRVENSINKNEKAYNEMKDYEKELELATKRNKELTEQYEAATADSETGKTDLEKMKSEIDSLVDERDALLEKNFAKYELNPDVKIDENMMFQALSMIKDKEINKDSYRTKIDIPDYKIGSLYTDDEFYLLYALDNFITAFSFTEDIRMKHIYITDLKNKKIVAEKAYNEPHLE